VNIFTFHGADSYAQDDMGLGVGPVCGFNWLIWRSYLQATGNGH
jgi:hypothetical protein